MGLFQAIGRQFGGAWSRLSVGHRLILVLLCLVCVGAMVAVALWARAPHYEVLYAGLSVKECAELAGSLRDAGIPSRMADGGTAILVPAAKADAARMAAAETGVPSTSHGGFEAFQTPKIGMTPFAERVTYVNALQNELASTIASLDSVSSARVHLVIPERSVFKQDSQTTRASVMVTARGGHVIGRNEGIAIANLVASAVPGLAPENVSVLDGRGNVLAGGGESDSGVAADDQFAYRKSLEAYLSSKAESMLSTVLGPDRCRVRVTADLSFEDSRETRREYDPDKRVLVSERIESSQSGARNTRLGGAAGGSGDGNENAQASAPPSNQSKSETVDTQYMVTEMVTEKVNRGATLNRLTVAAFVDLSPPAPPAEGEQAAAEGGDGAPSMEQIDLLIKEAVGFDAGRGDSLQIVDARFQASPLLAGQVGSTWKDSWLVGASRYLAIAMLGLVLLLVARSILRKMQTEVPRHVIIPEIMAAEGDQRQPLQASHDEVIRREIEKLVQGDPASAGRLLEGWVEGEN